MFKYGDLKKLLIHIRDRFRTTAFNQWDGSNVVLLRHDVDLDLAAAHRFALISKECGVSSTFFVLTTAETYNPSDRQSRTYLLDISRMGFEIGLHFDPTIYPEGLTLENLSRKVDQEAALLSGIVEKPIQSVSIHNPSMHGRYPLFPGYINAYDPKLFSEEQYLSDSRMVFRHDPFGFVARANRVPVQILLHPFHYTEDGAAYPEILARFVRTFVHDLDERFQDNSTYAAMRGEGLLARVAGAASPRPEIQP